MKCTSPIYILNPHRESFTQEKIAVPCGRCRWCRLEKAKKWAIRIMHESVMHKDNCMVTLTYNDEFLPNGLNPTLSKRDLQLFFKRLRRKGEKFRYFACGEYGENYLRPHYHILFFGVDFRDLSDIKQNGRYLTKKEIFLDTAWMSKSNDDDKEVKSMGLTHIGNLTHASAMYCAKYVTKKLNGPLAEIYKEKGIDPEFSLMSRRPGIGEKYYERYLKDEKADYCSFNGTRIGLPKYYKEKRYNTEEKKQEYRDKMIPFLEERQAELNARAIKNKISVYHQDKMERKQRDLNLKVKTQQNEKRKL
jgi:hypothetical protein